MSLSLGNTDKVKTPDFSHQMSVYLSSLAQPCRTGLASLSKMPVQQYSQCTVYQGSCISVLQNDQEWRELHWQNDRMCREACHVTKQLRTVKTCVENTEANTMRCTCGTAGIATLRSCGGSHSTTKPSAVTNIPRSFRVTRTLSPSSGLPVCCHAKLLPVCSSDIVQTLLSFAKPVE